MPCGLTSATSARGTKGGLKTDANANVLSRDGQPIAGLYATGNVSGAVTYDSYPGAGATLGPAMTFGVVAAEHLAQQTEQISMPAKMAGSL